MGGRSGGMGTKIQCKTYFPGYYSTRDLNEDAGSSWSRYHEDRMLSRHLYNGFTLKPVNGYSEYDKEILKRTMLEHEAIFRKQVYELHRLYRIQKDLMDEFQNKGYRSSVLEDTSQSNSFSSQMPSEGIKRIRQMPHLSMVSTNNNTHVAGTDDIRPPLDFFKESTVHSGQFLTGNGTPQKKRNSQESKLNRCPRRMLDLQLPADVYIDSEDADRKGKGDFADLSFSYTLPSNKIYCPDPGNYMKLTLGNCEGSSRQEDWKLDQLKQNGFPTPSLIDLNEPMGQIFREVSAGSASTHFFGSRIDREKNGGHHLSMRPNTSLLGMQSTLSKDRHSDKGSFSNLPYADKEEIRQEWPFYNNKAGKSRLGGSFFSSGPHNEELPTSSGAIQLKPARSDEISGRSPGLDISNKSGPAAPAMSSSFSVAPNLGYTASPQVSISANPVNSISHISQTFPCFKGSASVNAQSKMANTTFQDSNSTSDKWQRNGVLKPNLRLGNEASSYPNGLHHHFQLDSSNALFDKLNLNNKYDHSTSGNDKSNGAEKSFKGMQCTNMKHVTNVNLNQTILDGLGDHLTNQKDMGISTIEDKCHVSSGRISWLTKKQAFNESVELNKYASQMDLGFSQYYPQLSSIRTVDREQERTQQEDKGLSLSQDLHSTLKFENRIQMNEAYNNLSSKKVPGFPILDKIHKNAICSPSHQERSVTDIKQGREKDGLNYIDLSYGLEAPRLEKQISVGSPIQISSTRFTSCINLNSTYNQDSTEMSPEVEVQAPSGTVPSVVSKVAFEIDLEAPVASQVEENTLPLEESMPSSKADGSQEIECSNEALAREAAENILSMTLDKCSIFDGIMCGQSSLDPCDTLKWFAEVISSNECAKALREGDGGSESSDDGLDHFELMTLKLEETKVDGCWCRSHEPENQKVEMKSAASLLISRPRRGEARRRQRRDFQKDILPGLASLSRHEVTEDLQTIGGLMKALGCSWQTGSKRRNMSRSGRHSQARGRRQPRSLAVAGTEIQASPPPAQSTNAEFEIDGRTIIGWGRTTRRCRRQRCPSVNVSALI